MSGTSPEPGALRSLLDSAVPPAMVEATVPGVAVEQAGLVGEFGRDARGRVAWLRWGGRVARRLDG